LDRKMKLLAVGVVSAILIASVAGITLLNSMSDAKTYTNVSSVRLQVFGNANEDDTIDQRDIDYIGEVIRGDRKASNLTDANNDGTIDQADIAQVNAIIDREETMLYYVDLDGYKASVHYPVTSMVAIYNVYVEMVRALNASDLIIGVDDSISSYPTYFPELQSKPSVGNRFTPDVEKILALNPDVYFTGTRAYYDGNLEAKLAANGTDIDVVRLPCWEYGMVSQGLLTLGYLLGHEADAYEYLEWHDALLKEITDRVSSVSASDKVPSFQIRANGKTCSHGSGDLEVMELAGSINIADELSGTYPIPDIEWVIEKDPDVIVGAVVAGFYSGTNMTTLQDRYAQIIEMFNITSAVKSGNVHMMAFDITCGPSYLISMLYEAKWFYPDLFNDIDPQAVHQEYIDRFCGGIDLDVSTGAFVL